MLTAFYATYNQNLNEIDPLSLEILEGKFHEGQTIKVDVEDGLLKFTAS